jgi:excinuclease UvrABC helicase subunit UvrB
MNPLISEDFSGFFMNYFFISAKPGDIGLRKFRVNLVCTIIRYEPTKNSLR